MSIEIIHECKCKPVVADLVAALQRLIAVDDAHATIHAPDGDDVARMIEHAEAHKFAREVLARVHP